MGELVTLPRRSTVREVAAVEHPQAPAATHGFRAPDADDPAVVITAGLDGYRVWVRGRFYCERRTLTNAARIATHLKALAELGALPGDEPAGPEAA